MVIMLAWIFEETEEGYRALLGSEPRTDSEREWIPKDCVDNCIYASEGSPRFALLTLKIVPEDIRKKNPDLYRKFG